MEEKKMGLRARLRAMNVGDTLEIAREEWQPTSVRSSAYNIAADFGVKFEVRFKDYGTSVTRVE